MKHQDFKTLDNRDHIGDNTQNELNLVNSTVYFPDYNAAQFFLLNTKIKNLQSAVSISDFQGGTLQKLRIGTGNTGLYPSNIV